MFAVMKKIYRFMFIISHMQEIQNMIDSPLFIIDGKLMSAEIAIDRGVIPVAIPAAVDTLGPNVDPIVAQADGWYCNWCQKAIKMAGRVSHVKTKKHVAKLASFNAGLNPTAKPKKTKG
jgi:hypothetical protein